MDDPKPNYGKKRQTDILSGVGSSIRYTEECPDCGKKYGPKLKQCPKCGLVNQDWLARRFPSRNARREISHDEA